MTEAWLRGSISGVDPVISHLLRSVQHIREDVDLAVSRLTAAQIWLRPETMNPVGFHLKHLAGSIDRLLTYLGGNALSQSQLAAIPLEVVGTESGPELLASVHAALDRYEAFLKQFDPTDFTRICEVGRAKLPVAAISLAIHIAEHSHRHVGQLVSASALARATAP